MRPHNEICAEYTTIAALISEIFAEEDEKIFAPPSVSELMREKALRAYKYEVYLKEIFGPRNNWFPLPILRDVRTQQVVSEIDQIVDDLTSPDDFENIIITGQEGSGRKTTQRWLFAEILHRQANFFPIYISNTDLIAIQAFKREKLALSPKKVLEGLLGFAIQVKKQEYKHLFETGSNIVVFLPDADRIPMFKFMIERLMWVAPKIRFVITSKIPNNVIPIDFLGRFRRYDVEGITPEAAKETIERLSSRKMPQLLDNLQFRDGKWTVGRALNVFYLVESGKLTLIAKQAQTLEDEKLCELFFESLFEIWNLDSAFTFEFLERLAYLSSLQPGGVVEESRVFQEWIKLEVRQRKRLHQSEYLRTLCEKLEILDLYEVNSTRLYSIRERLFLDYFYTRALAHLRRIES
jgi:hypothetical protein